MKALPMAALAASGFLPHGYCIAWDPTLLWTMVAADGLIAVSYFSIPLALLYFVRASKRIQFDWILMMFSLFIFACGATHVMGIVNLWRPAYRLDAALMAVTAVVSVATAVMLWPLLPRVLAYMSARASDQSALRQLNGRLQESLTQLEQRRAEAEAGERRFRVILESAPNGMALLGPGGRWLVLNPALCSMLGYGEHEMLALDLLLLTHPDDRTALALALQDLFCGERPAYRGEVRLLHRDGHRVHAQLDVATIHGIVGQPLQAVAQIQDIGERKRAEDELRASRERFEVLVEGSPDYAMLMLDPQGHVVSWNSGAQRIKGYRADEITGRHYSAFFTPEDIAQQAPEAHLQIAAREGRCEDEGWRVRKDGTRFWANAVLTALRRPDGSLRGFAKVTRDLSERRKREEAIRLGLQEKETLLKEVYHRVKNNLQVISSLFSMQIRTLPEGEARQALRESAERVHAMSLVHEKLYQSGNLSSIDLANYIEDLCRRLANSSGAAARNIALDCAVDAVEVGLDTAVPLGLALNELVSNALKHAFVDRPSGRIQVLLKRLPDASLHLSVRDDGIGMPAESDPFSAGSLGLKLVRTLARQLDARFALLTTGGTDASLFFELRERGQGSAS